MQAGQKTVFITGATGTMGMQTLKQFSSRLDRFHLKLLIHDTPRDRKIIAPYRNTDGIELVYGDMRDSLLIDQCVHGADYVLHIGAMVSPTADAYPEATVRVNYGSTLNIINAIKKQDNADDIGLVFIGTIAETGDRIPPIHWGRCGDPIKGSMFDYYAVSKIAAERAVFESGLKKWVSIRQTGMLPTVSAEHPIIYHQNFHNVLEWVTAEESGLLMANVCEDWIPESFWRKAYNVGGGEAWRLTAWQLLEYNFKPMKRDFRAIFDPRDFALYNFHGHWFTDSDDLDAITHFRFNEPDAYFAQDPFLRRLRILSSIPLARRLIPNEERLKARMQAVSDEPSGTRWMLHYNKEDWITAFFGSREKQAQIKSWQDGYELTIPDKTPTCLDHGYDESKPTEDLNLDDTRGAAQFRGGECVSTSMQTGDLFTPLQWRCHKAHTFDATPNLILKGGHWCPECERTAWDYADLAQHSPFFAQVWTPLHGDDDAITIPKAFSDQTVLSD